MLEMVFWIEIVGQWSMSFTDAPGSRVHDSEPQKQHFTIAHRFSSIKSFNMVSL
jgi:hypothetical protein